MRSTLKTSGCAAMRASNSSLSALNASSMYSMPEAGEYARPLALRWELARGAAPPGAGAVPGAGVGETGPPGAGPSALVTGLHVLLSVLRERLRERLRGGIL